MCEAQGGDFASMQLRSRVHPSLRCCECRDTRVKARAMSFDDFRGAGRHCDSGAMRVPTWRPRRSRYHPQSRVEAFVLTRKSCLWTLRVDAELFVVLSGGWRRCERCGVPGIEPLDSHLASRIPCLPQVSRVWGYARAGARTTRIFWSRTTSDVVGLGARSRCGDWMLRL